MSAPPIHPQIRLAVKPYGSALPLGFFSFGVGMLLLAAVGAAWIEPAEGRPAG